MTRQYAKPIRKKLRELAGLAHERELSRVQETIFSSAEQSSWVFCPVKKFRRKWSKPSASSDFFDQFFYFLSGRFFASNSPEEHR